MTISDLKQMAGSQFSEDEYEEKLAKLEDKADKVLIDTTTPSWMRAKPVSRWSGFGD